MSPTVDNTPMLPASTPASKVKLIPKDIRFQGLKHRVALALGIGKGDGGKIEERRKADRENDQ